MPYYELKNGDFIDKGKMFFDPQFLEGMPEAEHLMLVQHDGQKLFVDTNNTKVISGKYLVSFDGLNTVNNLQRIPGGKVFMDLSGEKIEIQENKLIVIGMVVG
ncbi:S24/S26 family peptidase [Photobacterium frigidiphilum]|uniref:hypothetical protein n=1 Tax=Photobacterium frigidiphilum TaxID=264736 RepID=UPI00147477E5|nr:hypothetical protein [Photobacterium frigidiphilum]